jgi:hypothetical protein
MSVGCRLPQQQNVLGNGRLGNQRTSFSRCPFGEALCADLSAGFSSPHMAVRIDRPRPQFIPEQSESYIMSQSAAN